MANAAPADVKDGESHQTSTDLSTQDTDHGKQDDLDQEQQNGKNGDDESKYPGTKETVIIMVALLLAMFLIALDRTIVVTAIPRITDEFNSLQDVGWYGSAFMFTACAFQLPFGRVFTFNSPKWTFLSLIGLFEIGSVICGAAPNSTALIVGRAIAGIGSSGISSGAIIIMISVVPLKKRAVWQGTFFAMFGVASVIGPLVGGAFTTNVSWRWCFYINLPIGGVAMVVIAFLLKPMPPAQPGFTLRDKILQLDLPGQVFLLSSIICLLLALQWGGTTYPWSDGRVIALLTVFGVCLIGFVAVQCLMPKTATIPGRIARNRSIIAAQYFTFCLASAMMIMFYYIPFWFQAVKGDSAVRSGVDTLAMVLSLIVGSIGSGVVVMKLGYYTPAAIASSIVLSIGAGLIYTWQVNSSSAHWIPYQIIFGVGTGLGMQAGALAAQTTLSKKDVPVGVSLMFFWQQMGGAVFVSVGQNVLSGHLISGVTKLVPGLNPLDVVNSGATNLRSMVPAQDLSQVLYIYNGSLQQVYLIAVILGCVSIIGSASLEWRSLKGKQGPTAPKNVAEESELEDVQR